MQESALPLQTDQIRFFLYQPPCDVRVAVLLTYKGTWLNLTVNTAVKLKTLLTSAQYDSMCLLSGLKCIMSDVFKLSLRRL